MKKFVLFAIIWSFLICPALSATVEIEENTLDADNVIAPRWEDYVPDKYQNPRTDFTRGGSIAELSVGILLTDLIITCPIGIPMICHSSTKLKHIGYCEKKQIFEDGLKKAQKISDPEEREEYYQEMLKKCKFTEKDRLKLAKKRGHK